MRPDAPTQPLPDAPPPEPPSAGRTVAITLVSVLLFLYTTLGFLIVAGLGLFHSALSGAPLFVGPAAWGIATVVIIVILVQLARRRWRPAVAGAAAIAVAVSFGSFPLTSSMARARVCTPERVARLESVPAYGGQAIEVDAMGDPCGYTVTSSDPQDHVARYYLTALTDDGWKVHVRPNGSLEATRDGRRLTVELAPTEEGGDVQVLAW